MNFKFWNGKKPKNILSEYATKSLVEAVKIFFTTIATSLTNITPIGLVIGAGAKGMMDALLSKSSEIEKKLDRLIREPLLTGIQLLYEGVLYPEHDEKSRDSKDKLLHDAHVNLIKAWKLVIDSTEDSLFIRLLDCIATSAHSTHWQTTTPNLERLDSDIKEQTTKVEAFEEAARAQLTYTTGYRGFLDDETPERRFRDKPMHYGLLRIFGNNLEKHTHQQVVQANEHREKLTILISLLEVAKQLHALNLSRSKS